MVFRHDGKTYHKVEMHFYRTGEMDVLQVFAPPKDYLIFVVDCEGVHRADAAEIRSLASKYDMRGLLKALPGGAASAA
ncbi:MAG TPA: hypothetical protein VHP11_03085 [Tepidisphaeraceae bacterium]|jgi:hypothetical protein|nr:hypothetical protein [Tepidisphaeraceae bacterium]